jgi:hypothetical protein
MLPELPELLNALMLLPSKINGVVQVLHLDAKHVPRLPLSRVFRGFTALLKLWLANFWLFTEELCLWFQEETAKANPR